MTHEEIKKEANKLGISARKLEDLRDSGLFYKPIDKEGVARGIGVNWLYPGPSISIPRLERLAELTKEYRSKDEVRWHLWLEGDLEQWGDIKNKLIKSFPDIHLPVVDDQEGFLDKFSRKGIKQLRELLRRKRLGITEKESWESAIYNLIWDILVTQENPYEDDEIANQEFIDVFGEITLNFIWILRNNGIYSPQKWHNELSNSDSFYFNKLRSFFQLLEEDIENDKKFATILLNNIGYKVLWKIRAIFSGILLLMLPFIPEEELNQIISQAKQTYQ